MILFLVEYSRHIVRIIFPKPVIDDPLSISVCEVMKLINPTAFAGRKLERGGITLWSNRDSGLGGDLTWHDMT